MFSVAFTACFRSPKLPATLKDGESERGNGEVIKRE